MIEFIKHALGLCGEHHHPNIFNISLIAGSLVTAFYFFKFKLKLIFRFNEGKS